MTDLVVDTSAALAILFAEPTGPAMIDALDGASTRRMSAVSLVELGIVLEARFGPVGMTVADRFVADAGVEVVPVDREQSGTAVAAWRAFGRGRHRAALNLSDCFTYALAATLGGAVLCTGADFSATDISTVPAGSVG